jgi:hypothetical protein
MSGEKATLTHDRPHAVVSFDGKDTVSIGRRQHSERRRYWLNKRSNVHHKAGRFPALQGLFDRDCLRVELFFFAEAFWASTSVHSKETFERPASLSE